MNEKIIQAIEEYLKCEKEVNEVRGIPLKLYEKWGELYKNIVAGKDGLILKEEDKIFSKFMYKLVIDIKTENDKLQVLLDKKNRAIEEIKKLSGFMDNHQVDALIITYENLRIIGQSILSQ